MSVKVDNYLFPATRERTRKFCGNARPTPKEASKGYIQMMKQEMGKEKFREYAAWEVDYIDQHHQRQTTREHMGCLAGSCAFIINWQGMLRPCIMINEPSVPVFELGFEAAWQQIRAKSDKIYLPAPCSRCTKEKESCFQRRRGQENLHRQDFGRSIEAARLSMVTEVCCRKWTDDGRPAVGRCADLPDQRDALRFNGNSGL